SRRGDAALPVIPELAELDSALPAGTVYVSPSLVDDELYLLSVRRGAGARVFGARGSAAQVREQVQGFRACVQALLTRYSRLPMGAAERRPMDDHLERPGQGPLGTALRQILGPNDRLLWIPDDDLHGVPIHALRCRGRYLIEEHEIVFGFSGALVVHQARTARDRRRRWGRALVVTESPTVLPAAGLEGGGGAAAFRRSLGLSSTRASRAEIGRHLARAGVLHLACHAFFDADHPLAAHLRLPSGEDWRAVEWLDAPVAGLPLVT